MGKDLELGIVNGQGPGNQAGRCPNQQPSNGTDANGSGGNIITGIHTNGWNIDQGSANGADTNGSSESISTDINGRKDGQGGEGFPMLEGELGRILDPRSKEFRLRRAMSDKHFKAQLAPVHADKKDYSKCGMLVLAYQTLGVVFGGLGTSPLYVWPSIQLDNPDEKDFLGVMSIIFWTVTLVALIKYGFIIVNADNHGEGGTFALYSLLCRHANLGQRPESSPQDTIDETCNCVNEGDKAGNGLVANKLRALLENWQSSKVILFLVVMLGTGLVIGDGVLTPAISVLSAMAGIQSEDPSIKTSVVTWVSAAILVMLFLLQRFGTHCIGFMFSPIMLAWFVTTPIVGIYNICRYYPTVFKAVSPQYIIEYFKINGKSGWVALGGIVLCITGAESSFADLGHFNKHSLQIAWALIVYPSLILTYAGETAYLIKNPLDHRNAFFKSIPQQVYWPMFVVATLAAIVASQSLITATFSLIKQCMSLGCFPRVKMVHTSPDKEGQVYSPEVNYVLMILCIAVVLGFQDAQTLGNAFGVAVVGVMFITTTLVTIVMILVWRLPWPLALLFICVYGTIEGVYFTSVLNKVPEGGWVPFLIGVIFLMISLCWSYGRRKKYAYETCNKISLDSLGSLLSSSGTQRVPGLCFFYSDLAHGIPPIITHYVRNVRTLHQVLVFTTIKYLPVKTVLPEERFHIGRVGFKGVYRCIARYGYQDVMDCKDGEFRDQALQSLKLYLETEDRNKPDLNGAEYRTPSFQRSIDAHNVEDLEELERARGHDAVYVVGKVNVRTSLATGWLGRLAINQVYALLRVLCRSAVKELQIPPAHYLEVGMLYEI